MDDHNTQRIVATGEYLRLVRQDHWEYAQRINVSGIVGMVAVTPDDELLLVEQYRVPVENQCIELPAGLVGDEDRDENLQKAAIRELLEETGYEASEMVYLCDGPPSSGTSNEVINLYLAKGLRKVNSGGGDPTEKITVHAVPLGQIDEWLSRKRRMGILIDLRIYTALYLLQHL